MNKHSLKVRIGKRIDADPGIVGTQMIGIRERVLRHLFGPIHKMMLIVPGDSVDQIHIQERPSEDDLMALAKAVGVARGGDAA